MARRAFDGDLQGYMLYFIRQKLRYDLLHLAQDIRSETVLAITMQPNLRKQLYEYLQTNAIPAGKDLSLLKAVMFRQRLRLIEKETRHPTSRLMYEPERGKHD